MRRPPPLLFVFLLSGFLFWPPSVQGETLFPASFQEDWIIQGNIGVQTSPLGFEFIRIAAPKGEMARLTAKAPVPVVEGQKLQVSMGYRTDVANSRRDYGAWIFLKLMDEQGHNLGVAEVVCPAADSWRNMKQSIPIPQGVSKVGIQVRLQNSGGAFDVRSLEMQAVNPSAVGAGAGDSSLEEMERFELVRDGAKSLLRSGKQELPLKNTPSAAGDGLPLAFVLPENLCDSTNYLYQIEISFSKGAPLRAGQNAALFTLGRNITGAAQPDSFSLMIYSGEWLMARLTSENPRVKTEFRIKEANTGLALSSPGQSHRFRILFGGKKLKAWLDEAPFDLEEAQMQRPFSWPKGRSFYIGSETATENIWPGKIDEFSLTVLHPWLTVNFKEGRNGGYFIGRGPHVWGAEFADGSAKGLTATFQVKGVGGGSVGKPFGVDAISAKDCTFTIPDLPYGCYQLETSFEKDGKRLLDRRNFVIVPALDRGPASESPFGITTEFPLDGNHFDAALTDDIFRRIAASGMRWFRLWLRWDDIEHAPGEYHWENMDKVVELAQKHGLQLYPCLTGGTLSFQTTEPLKKESWGLMTTACYMPKDLAIWRNYLRALAERYKGKIHYYQIWNEPDARNGFYPFDPKAYVEVLKASHETLKSVDPGIRVGLGGFAAAFDANQLQKKQFSKEDTCWPAASFYALDPGAYFDIVDAHFYSIAKPDQSWDSVAEDVPLVVGYLKSVGEGDKPLWNSETSMYSGVEGKTGGWGNVPFLSEEAQAMELIRFHVQSLAVGIQRSFWYGFAGECGVIRQDYSPKPAYASQVNLIRLIQGASFLEKLTLGDNIRAYRFKVSGRELIVLWTTGNTVHLEVMNPGGKEWTQYDMYGNGQKHLGEPVASLELDKQPQFLSSSTPLDVKPLVNLSLAPVNSNVRPNGGLLQLFNPSAKPVQVAFSLSAGGKAGEVQKIELEPKASKSVKVDLPAWENPVHIEARFSGGMEQSFDFSQNLLFRKVVALDGANEKTILLDRENQLKMGGRQMDLQGRVISNQLWKGARDVSLEMKLHREGDMVVLHAVITDDKVVPAAPGQPLWNGDGLEIFLKKVDGASFQMIVAPDGRLWWAGEREWKGFQTKVHKTPKGYEVQGRFPVEVDRLEFNVALDDADDFAGRRTQLFWDTERNGILLCTPPKAGH